MYTYIYIITSWFTFSVPEIYIYIEYKQKLIKLLLYPFSSLNPLFIKYYIYYCFIMQLCEVYSRQPVTLFLNQEEFTCSLVLRENCILVIPPFVAQKTSTFIRIILKASSWITKQHVPFTHSSNIYCILTLSVFFRFQIWWQNHMVTELKSL